jgi:hypothetical protein
LERRAAGAQTASGAFVTVLFGLAVGALGTGFALHPLPLMLVTDATLLLLWAALFAVLVQVPRRRLDTAGEALLDVSVNYPAWQSVHWLGTARVAQAMAGSLIETRRINEHKAWDLQVAYYYQGLAIATLGAALVVSLLDV